MGALLDPAPDPVLASEPVSWLVGDLRRALQRRRGEWIAGRVPQGYLPAHLGLGPSPCADVEALRGSRHTVVRVS